MPKDTAESTATTQFGGLLDLLGIGADERVSICSQRPDQRDVFEATIPLNRADCVALATSASYVDKRDVWFGVNPVDPTNLPPGKRGGEGNVTRCAALFADFDFKRGGVSDSHAANTVSKEISAALGQMPTAVVFSGHGGHTYWALDAEDDGWTLDTDAKRIAAQAIYRRFHRLCADIAARFGGGVDNVGQLSRVLRVPGTHNRKDPGHPIPVTLTPYPYGTSGPLSVREVVEALDACGVPEMDEDRATLGAEVSAPSGWTFGDRTTPYVSAMVAGWPSDRPASRHGWLVSSATRLACAHRLARINERDHGRAAMVLANAFGALLQSHGEVRKATPGEVAGAQAWGMLRAASMTDEQAADEIGGAHDDNWGDEESASGAAITLPAAFWESRQSLRHIRDAAWSMLASPDAALAITLANLSASVPPCVRVDTGVRRAMPTHTFAAPVGRSGGFKSSAMEAAELAVTFSRSWSTDPMSTDGPVMVAQDDEPGDTVFHALGGTGQGIIENFMGEVALPLPEGARANARPRSVRRQVRSNVLVSIDEGNGLAKALADPNSIVGETLRELWSGVTTGQGNAKAENRRSVRRGAYSFGLVVGFQLAVLARLLSAENVELGTPQRFLFAWTGAPDFPEEPVAFPGVLTVVIPAAPVTMCPALLARVRSVLVPLLRNAGSDDEADSQRVSVLVRLAALLAILDGRAEVSEDDWMLAEMMADTSRAIAGYALAVKRGQSTRDRNTRRAEQVADAIAIHTATEGSGADRAAVRVETAIRTEGVGGRRAKWTGDDGIRRAKFASSEREDADAGLALMIERGAAVATVKGRTTFVELVDG